MVIGDTRDNRIVLSHVTYVDAIQTLKKWVSSYCSRLLHHNFSQRNFPAHLL
ncbi:hypothetical protein ALC56_12796 [Trachymyrmex septentrionalis]|uniref:Uncharacterized protein n=1 Tax=Trachymyrmex septentrionalis TaxID=34720 RepID=A0A195EX91_9HYME|nr:hypothetical protein ALC56_12796 [Trachymyrmex septentrionalis]